MSAKEGARLPAAVRRASGWALAALAACWLSPQAARAANPARLNIDVTVVAGLSVFLDGAQSSSTQTVSWNTASGNALLASPVPLTVTNNTAGTQEKWALSVNGASINTAGNPDVWTLDVTTTTLPGTDSFSVQAVFGSSNTAAGGCPATGSSDWDQAFAPPLTTALTTYTTGVFADPSLNNNGSFNPDRTNGNNNGKMFPNGTRALCWRVITPSMTSTADQQNIQVIVTAQ